ncbi:hypothetical protein FDECE_15218 [Fusarium decemcellulare]|nr:hypothetical protein FDECE_15218 [Fusarium decemcellulare]
MPTPPETEPENDGHIDLSLDALLVDTESQRAKLALHDLLRVWIATRPSSDDSPNGNVISANLKKAFFVLIFDRWSSLEDFVILPTLADKKFLEMAVKVGKLTETLPITPQKHKRGASE